mgnify:CR=1 FL=1
MFESADYGFTSGGAQTRAPPSRPLRRRLGALPLSLVIGILHLVSCNSIRQELAADAGGAGLAALSAAPDAEPFWGCEAPALPLGAFHVVVSTFNAEPEQLLPWMWHLGLTNAGEGGGWMWGRGQGGRHATPRRSTHT